MNEEWFECYCLRKFGKHWQDLVDDLNIELKGMYDDDSLTNNVRFFIKNKYIFPSFKYLQSRIPDSVVHGYEDLGYAVWRDLKKGIDVTLYNDRKKLDPIKPIHVNAKKVMGKKYEFTDLPHVLNEIFRHERFEGHTGKLALLTKSKDIFKFKEEHDPLFSIIYVDDTEEGSVPFDDICNAIEIDGGPKFSIFRNPSYPKRRKLLMKKRVRTVDSRKFVANTRIMDIWSNVYTSKGKYSFTTYVNLYGLEEGNEQKEFEQRCKYASALASIVAYSNGWEPHVSLLGVDNENFNFLSLDRGAVVVKEMNKQIAEKFNLQEEERITSLKDDEEFFEALRFKSGINDHEIYAYSMPFWTNEQDPAFEYAKTVFDLKEDILAKGEYYTRLALHAPDDATLYSRKGKEFSKVVLAEKISKQWNAHGWTRNAYNNFIPITLTSNANTELFKNYLKEHYEMFPYIKVVRDPEIKELSKKEYEKLIGI